MNSELETMASLEVADVWTGASAAFDLYTHGDWQFVVFYDADRNTTVGQRRLGEECVDEHRTGESAWTFSRLPEERKIGWDAHNDLVLAVDADGRLHVAGNMHGHPLTYFRSTEPLDVTTFERVPEMVGSREAEVTYPRFFRGPDGRLVFEYRDGRSGGGDWLYNVYDHERGTWQRLLDEPLTHGGERMNAYPHGPVVGPDGYYHCCWVWRDSPDAATNHDLCYARSPDLQTWETSSGEELELPITLETAEVVDPVPPGGGAINGNTVIGFDAAGRVVLSYHKFDDEGNTQVYNARPRVGGERERGTEGGWEITRASDWEYRWEFGGHGSIPFEIEVGPVESVGDDTDGRLEQWYDHAEYGRGTWLLDGETLDPVGERSPWSRYPPELLEVESTYPEMGVNWADDSGASPAGVEYALRWEALRPNRDRERDRVPPSTTLRVYEFESGE